MKLFRPLLTASICLLSALFVEAQAPAGYYSSLSGKKDAELKTAVYMLVHNFTKVSSYTALPSYFMQTDLYPESRQWWDMYGNEPFYAPSFAGLNREHSFPKSWWGGSTSVGAYVDLNHLYPSEAAANQAKSNYPLGTVDTSAKLKFGNGVSTVGYPVNGQGGGAAFVFEPDDEYKGDFARTYFYMVTCYQDLSWKYTYMLEQNTYPTLNDWAVKLLLKWHHDDGVSQKEIDRNEAVFKIQNNRNPFIDMPELADYIWGTKKGQSFTPGQVVVPPSGDPELIAPVKNMELEFGEVALGSSVTRDLFVSGKFLKGYVNTTLYTADAAMFAASESKIPAASVCSDQGYWLHITYKPTAVGEHTSRLLLDGDFGSRGVALRGQCLPVPVLTACTATAPSDVEPDRYIANWTVPAGETVDYFVVTRTRYSGSSVTTEEINAEENYAEMLDFDKSDREAYSVQSVRLGHRSPMSNVVFVDHTGIAGVVTDQPLVVQSFDGFIRFICSVPQTGCRIYNAAGILVKALDTVEQNLDVELPQGVYLIVTDRHSTPIKAVVR